MNGSPFRRGFVLGLTLALLLCSCSTTQFQRLKAHGAAVGIGLAGGALAVATGGTAGLALAGTGLAGGVMADQALEPEPEVHVERVTTVVQVPPPLPDGTPAKPRVQSFVDRAQTPAPDNLKLPGGFQVPTPVGFWDRVWLALQVVWWVCVASAAIVFLLTHPRALSVAWGLVRCAFGLAQNAVKTAWMAIRAPIKRANDPPTAPPDPEKP